MNPISPCWCARLSQNRVQSPTSWPVAVSSAARQSALPSVDSEVDAIFPLSRTLTSARFLGSWYR
jgi:hypothetical protein